MDYTNTEVNLTINLEGCIATRGSYEFKPKGFSFAKVNDQMEKTPTGILITKRLPTNCICFKSTTLNSAFVNHAISDKGCPNKREVSPHFWRGLSKKNRLIYHINRYVEDTHGKCEFSFEVIS